MMIDIGPNFYTESPTHACDLQTFLFKFYVQAFKILYNPNLLLS